MNVGYFSFTLILLTLTVGVKALFHRFRIPGILGYLMIGFFLSPFLLSMHESVAITHEVAELGVVFLLFTIGLEFSWARLLTIRRDVFFLGTLEVSLSMLLTMLIGTFLGLSKTESFLIGGVLSLSSTALVTKQLKDQLELVTVHGLKSLGILLFQDLAVIPLLIVIPALAGLGSEALVSTIGIAFMKAVGVISILLLGGKYVFRPFFYMVAKTRSIELFTLTTLLVTLGSAWMTAQLGLSMALGAFLSGIILGETEFCHQIQADIRPFRDVLLGLFFVSIGIQLDLRVLWAVWPSVLVLWAALITLKALLVIFIVRLTGSRMADAFRTGLVLAQGGEFGFVILTVALHYQLLTDQYVQVILGALFLSMLTAPMIIRFNGRLARCCFPEVINTLEQSSLAAIGETAKPLHEHVIIAGFGRLGQNTAKLLTEFHVPYLALDLDAPRVEKARLAGELVCYGDACSRDVLLAAGLEEATVIIVTVNDTQVACEVLRSIRQQSATIPVILRTNDESDAEYCYSLGATAVIPEMLEASLAMGMHLLLMLNKPIHEINRVLNRIRRDRYGLLREVIPGEETWDRDEI